MAAPPLESLEKLGAHDHIGFLCRDPRERLETLVPFLRIGLSRGEKCLLCCAHRDGDEILAAVSAAGIDIGGALARGAIIASRGGRDEAAALDPDAIVAFLRAAAQQARSEKHAALRIVIDISFVLGGEADSARVNTFQAKLHEFLAGQDVLSLCVHDIEGLPPEILMGALRTHPQVIYDGKLLDNFLFTPPSVDPAEMTARRVFDRHLAQLVERNVRNDRIRRQAIRLRKFRDVTASLLAREAMSEILNGIAVGVISLGYRMCWIGMAEPDHTVVPVAQWGDMNGYLREVAVRWDDVPLGQGPVGRAIREGKPDVVRDVLRSRRFAPWRESALGRGILSVAAFPLGAGTPADGALVVYAPEMDAFDAEAVEELSAYAQQATLVVARARELQAVAESEERFRSVVENTDVLVIELDPSGRIVLFNRAAEKITGHDAAEVLGKEYFTLFVSERDRDRLAADYAAILKGRTMAGFTSPIRTKDGNERILSWNITSILGAGGELRGIVGMGLDITDRLRAEQEKETLRGILAEARKMEAVGALAGAIGHDFNNVLGAIIGYASLMQSRMDPDDPLCDAARKIQEQASRAGELTRKLLGFARRGERRADAVSLNDVAASVVGAIAASFDRSIEVRTGLDPSLPLVEGDAGELEQSVLDLCLNARDAMPGGGILSIETGVTRLSETEAQLHQVAGAGDYATIVVRDTGEGITDENRQRIFEPFYTTRREMGRSGMGLPTVYGIVKSHAGAIEVESAPGRGAAFRIYLPVTARRKVRRPAPAVEPLARGAGTILIVDDEASIREMARDLLTSLGYDTLVAEDGEVACRIFRERRGGIALVLLDIVMPRMGGKETFETLRSLSPSLPILLSSGYMPEGDAQELLARGADGFIQKPYSLSELAAAVRRALDAHAA